MDYLIHHMLRTSAGRFATNEALVCGSERLTFDAVSCRVVGLAQGLKMCGVGRGDRVGIYLDPCVPQAVSFFAISQAGGAFVPVNGVLQPSQVVHIANDCGMKGLITSQAKLSSLGACLGEMRSVEFVVVVDKPESIEIPVPMYLFEDLCMRSRSPSEPPDEAIEKDLAGILYTSGSTGKPKGVMVSHSQVMAGSSIVSTYLNISEKDRILGILPFSFDAGLNQLMTAIQQGATLVLMGFVFAREIVQMLAKESITGLAGVPTLWGLLVRANSGLAKTSLPHLRYITNTGGAMPGTVLAELRRNLPNTRIFLMYGLTEAFRSTYLPPEELDRRPTSMGKAIPNTEILVINEKGERCKPGETGELIHRGPTVSMGYWGQPEATAGVLRPHPFLASEFGDTEKVCYSGDLVRMDEEGYLYFVGRRDTMIKSSGFRVSHTEVEEVLLQNDSVLEAAVIGIPDELLGQSIKAFIVPRDKHSFDMNVVISFCSQRLPKYMVPKCVQVIEAMPKTPNGKIDHPALRRREGILK